MRISDARVNHLAADIAAALTKAEYVRVKVKENVLAERIAKLLLDNFQAEVALEEEAERLADKHARQMAGMDHRKIVEGIKARLAKERGFVL